VHWLDGARDEKGLTKAERRMIKSVITELAGELLAERDDAALKAVYNKYSRSNYDNEETASLEDAKSMLETMLGVELGDDLDMSSHEDVLRRAQAQFEADQQAREARQAKRKKSPKQLAREAQLQAEEAQISQSIREVYRQLVSALHPDREPDPQERDRKTIAERCGVNFQHTEFQHITLTDADGVAHKFDFTLRLLGDRVALGAHEIHET
jgi:hypothetical protein